MKYKTLFRLALKAIGVWLLVGGMISFVSFVGYLLISLFPTSGVSYGPFSYRLTQAFGPVVQMGIGAYLFLDGKWVADKAIPSNCNYCHECGYDLTGAVGHICVECGTPFKAPENVREG
ncbi:MAG TPA: hypothetical protein VH518_04655 [Tepidisphaeraceae bacterium]|jgi:hypothetical protein